MRLGETVRRIGILAAMPYLLVRHPDRFAFDEGGLVYTHPLRIENHPLAVREEERRKMVPDAGRSPRYEMSIKRRRSVISEPIGDIIADCGTPDGVLKVYNQLTEAYRRIIGGSDDISVRNVVDGVMGDFRDRASGMENDYTRRDTFPESVFSGRIYFSHLKRYISPRWTAAYPLPGLGTVPSFSLSHGENSHVDARGFHKGGLPFATLPDQVIIIPHGVDEKDAEFGEMVEDVCRNAYHPATVPGTPVFVYCVDNLSDTQYDLQKYPSTLSTMFLTYEHQYTGWRYIKGVRVGSEEKIAPWGSFFSSSGKAAGVIWSRECLAKYTLDMACRLFQKKLGAYYDYIKAISEAVIAGKSPSEEEVVWQIMNLNVLNLVVIFKCLVCDPLVQAMIGEVPRIERKDRFRYREPNALEKEVAYEEVAWMGSLSHRA